MIKLFIDSDIILDLLIRRHEYQGAAELFTRIAHRDYSGCTTPIVCANVHYIITKYEGKAKSIQSLKKLRQLLSILPIDEETIDKALISEASDFEDAIEFITAEKNQVDFIITRNGKDYRHSSLPVLTAADFLKIKP